VVLKLSRLYQPRNPRFWLMLTLNLLSMALGWITHTYTLLPLAALAITVLAVSNAVIGTVLAVHLMRTPPLPAAPPPRAAP